MTLDQTRQLGIEFERRVQTLLPSTKTVDKLDTEDIYSFLNQYQNQFVKELYITKDRVQPNSNAANRIDDYLKSLIVAQEFPMDSTDQIKIDNFNMYIDSASNVIVNYSSDENGAVSGTVSNDYIDSNQLKQIQKDSYNNHRILRRPIITMTSSYNDGYTYFQIIYDDYTTINSVYVRYIKIPANFTILGDGVACELPYECFNELVEGAVQLYINYVSGDNRQAQNASKQPQNQRNQQNNQRDNQQEDEQ